MASKKSSSVRRPKKRPNKSKPTKGAAGKKKNKTATRRGVARPLRTSQSGRARSRLAAWAADSMTSSIDAVWDQSDGSQMSNCAAGISRPNRDCNCFLKNAARGFFSAKQAFDDAATDADGIIGLLADSANGWTEIANPDGNGTQRTADAIAAFNDDQKVVIAGMTSGDLGDTHGHLALVVKGTETAGSAKLEVPKCTAGSISDAARVKDKGVNWSFGKTMPRQVRYFWRVPDAPGSTTAARGRQASQRRAK